MSVDVHAIAARLLRYEAAIAVAQSVTGVGGPEAEEALAVIRAALGALAAGDAGELTADQVLAELGKLAAGEAADDAAADAVLAARRQGGV